MKRWIAKNASCRSATLLLCAAIAGIIGCSTRKAETQQAGYFTSGSKEADQRAAQEMAKAQQLSGSGEGAGEAGVKKAKPAAPNAQGTDGQTNVAAQATGKLTLFARLGGEAGISNVVADFLPRVIQDPRVNWDRNGVVRGGLSFHRNRSETWNPTPQHEAILKKHMVQFLVLATGGPAHYTGMEMGAAHANLHISNPEFDAAMGDLKETLDKFKIPNMEQKELLAVIETTRPEIVTER
ncbi:MAG TPA: group 1 truncated hemoglobin [Verrucomicrobiae bacterium]|nr:group 1 truncated hemoglobin [Verrucomicrobiae bacterium]